MVTIAVTVYTAARPEVLKAHMGIVVGVCSVAGVLSLLALFQWLTPKSPPASDDVLRNLSNVTISPVFNNFSTLSSSTDVPLVQPTPKIDAPLTHPALKVDAAGLEEPAPTITFLNLEHVGILQAYYKWKKDEAGHYGVVIWIENKRADVGARAGKAWALSAQIRYTTPTGEPLALVDRAYWLDYDQNILNVGVGESRGIVLCTYLRPALTVYNNRRTTPFNARSFGAIHNIRSFAGEHSSLMNRCMQKWPLFPIGRAIPLL